MSEKDLGDTGVNVNGMKFSPLSIDDLNRDLIVEMEGGSEGIEEDRVRHDEIEGKEASDLPELELGESDAVIGDENKKIQSRISREDGHESIIDIPDQSKANDGDEDNLDDKKTLGKEAFSEVNGKKKERVDAEERDERKQTDEEHDRNKNENEDEYYEDEDDELYEDKDEDYEEESIRNELNIELLDKKKEDSSERYRDNMQEKDDGINEKEKEEENEKDESNAIKEKEQKNELRIKNENENQNENKDNDNENCVDKTVEGFKVYEFNTTLKEKEKEKRNDINIIQKKDGELFILPSLMNSEAIISIEECPSVAIPADVDESHPIENKEKVEKNEEAADLQEGRTNAMDITNDSNLNNSINSDKVSKQLMVNDVVKDNIGSSIGNDMYVKEKDDDDDGGGSELNGHDENGDRNDGTDNVSNESKYDKEKEGKKDKEIIKERKKINSNHHLMKEIVQIQHGRDLYEKESKRLNKKHFSDYKPKEPNLEKNNQNEKQFREKEFQKRTNEFPKEKSYPNLNFENKKNSNFLEPTLPQKTRNQFSLENEKYIFEKRKAMEDRNAINYARSSTSFEKLNVTKFEKNFKFTNAQEAKKMDYYRKKIVVNNKLEYYEYGNGGYGNKTGGKELHNNVIMTEEKNKKESNLENLKLKISVDVTKKERKVEIISKSEQTQNFKTFLDSEKTKINFATNLRKNNLENVSAEKKQNPYDFNYEFGHKNLKISKPFESKNSKFENPNPNSNSNSNFVVPILNSNPKSKSNSDSNSNFLKKNNFETNFSPPIFPTPNKSEVKQSQDIRSKGNPIQSSQHAKTQSRHPIQSQPSQSQDVRKLEESQTSEKAESQSQTQNFGNGSLHAGSRDGRKSNPDGKKSNRDGRNHEDGKFNRGGTNHEFGKSQHPENFKTESENKKVQNLQNSVAEKSTSGRFRMESNVLSGTDFRKVKQTDPNKYFFENRERSVRNGRHDERECSFSFFQSQVKADRDESKAGSLSIKFRMASKERGHGSTRKEKMDAENAMITRKERIESTVFERKRNHVHPSNSNSNLNLNSNHLSAKEEDGTKRKDSKYDHSRDAKTIARNAMDDGDGDDGGVAMMEVGNGKDIFLKAYSDDKMKRSKLQLYIPRSGKR